MKFLNTYAGAIALVVLLVIYNLLFWHQGGFGANLPLYALACVLGMAALNFKKQWNYRQGISLAALLLTSLAHYYVGSAFATVMLFVSLFTYAAFFHEERLQAVTSVIPQLLAGLFRIPERLVQRLLMPRKKSSNSTSALWQWTKLAMLPLLILSFYIGIYRGANPKFEQMTAGFFEGLFEGLEYFLAEIFTAHSLFLMLGAVLTSLLLFRLAPNSMVAFESRFTDIKKRSKEKRPHWKAPDGMNSLEQERKAGIVLLVLMNGLLLVLNFIDISWIWLGFTVPENFNLKQFVHEGTWLLILSIFMSILILLYLFRGNLNFHPKRKTLQWLALAWVAQNFVLGFSVFLRNYHYINFHGLAGKRIGVIIFLALVLFGLITMALKIRDKRTGFNLIKLNAWAAFILLALTSVVDWDTLIVQSNLDHSNPAEIDVDYYLSMAPHTYPLIYDNLNRIATQINKHSNNSTQWISITDPAQFKEQLDKRSEWFIKDYEARGYWAKTASMKACYHLLIHKE